MKKDKKDLQGILLLIMKHYNKNKIVISQVVDFMVARNILPGRALSILNTNTPIQFISDAELCLLTLGLYNATMESRIDPSKFFHEEELKNVESFYTEKQKIRNTLVIHNVDQIKYNHFACTAVPCTTMAEWFGAGLLTYNPNTQRATKKRVIDGEMVEVANIDPDAVEDIARKLMQGLFFSNMVTLNIRKLGTERFKYNEKTRTMTIYVDNDSTIVDIPDGMHRIGGMVKAIERMPDLAETMMLRILHCDEREVGRFIVQEATHTDINEETLAFYNPENAEMEIVKQINLEGSKKTNSMFQKIGKDIAEVEYGNKYTTYQTLALAINHNFEFEDAREVRLIKAYLIDGFNEIIGIFKSEFRNLTETRKNFVLADSNIFIVFIAILSILYRKENWREMLEKIVSRIDYSRDDELWDNINFSNTNINRSVVKKISSYFKALYGPNV